MRRTKMIRELIVLSLAMLLAVPNLALAGARSVTSSGTTGGSTGAVTSPEAPKATEDGRHSLLMERVRTVLQTRERTFSAAHERISARAERVEQIAAQVEKAGGDVSAVRRELEAVQEQLRVAAAYEIKAMQMFRGVPDAGNRRGAFDAARVQARNARMELTQARDRLRNAIMNLRSVANGLKGAEQ